MHTALVVLYLATFATEATGFVLLVLEARSSTKNFRKWVDANPRGNPSGSSGQLLQMNLVITGLIGDARRRWIAVALIGVGILLGLVANLVSL